MILVAAVASPDSDQALLDLQPVSRTLLTVCLPPAASGARVFADILVRLGKVRSRGPQSTSLSAYARDVGLWLPAYGTRVIVVVGAGGASVEAFRPLDTLARRLGIALWLVVDEHQAAKASVRLWEMVERIAPLDELKALRSSTADSPLEAGATMTAGPTMTAAGHWVAELDRIDHAPQNPDAFALGFCAGAGMAREDRANRDVLARWMRSLLEPMEDHACLRAAVAGLKGALHAYGWQVRLDLRRLAGEPHEPTMLERMRSLDLTVLDEFSDPLTAAGLTLAGLELTISEMLAVRRSEVAPDGSTVAIGRDQVNVPAVGRPLLRAQMLSGDRIGASADDPLLGQPATIGASRLRSLVLSIYAEVDALQTPHDLVDRPTRDERWLIDRGVSIDRADSREGRARQVGTDSPDERIGDLRADLANAWAQGTVGTYPCACRVDHIPPHPDELPQWPPVARRTVDRSTHSWYQLNPKVARRLRAEEPARG